MWQRWNGTSHIFEKSDDNGSSWAPLPLNAATVNEGQLPVARLGNFLNTPNVWTADQTITNAGVVFAGSTAIPGPSIWANTNILHIRGGTGGLKVQPQAGGTDLLLLSNTGALSVNGAGPHYIGPAGAGSTIASLVIQGGSGAAGGGLAQFVRGGTTVGWVGAEAALLGGTGDVLTLYSPQPAGISISAAGASSYIFFKLGGVLKHIIAYDGGLYPNTDNSGYLGWSSLRYASIRAVTITPGDLTFDNGWTVTEAEKLGIAESGLVFLDADENLVAFVGAQGFKDISTVTYNKTTKKQRSLMPRVDHHSLLDPRELGS